MAVTATKAVSKTAATKAKAPVRKAAKTAQKTAAKAPAKATAKATTKAAAKTASPERKGRASQFAGTRITGLFKENPRRQGTWGWKSYEIIRKAKSMTVSYEDYIKAGGRPQDLRWDIDHEFVHTGV